MPLPSHMLRPLRITLRNFVWKEAQYLAANPVAWQDTDMSGLKVMSTLSTPKVNWNVPSSSHGNDPSPLGVGDTEDAHTLEQFVGIVFVVFDSKRPGCEIPVVTVAFWPGCHVQQGSPSSRPLCFPSPLKIRVCKFECGVN